MRSTLRIFLAIFFLLNWSQNSFATEIISSIKPIDSLVKMIVDNTKKTSLLINDNSSPHGFNLKPSHIKMMNEADIIFYVDDDFEGFLPKIMDSSTHLKRVPLFQYANLRLWSYRTEYEWESKPAKQGDKNVDRHIWLDTRNAKEILKIIRDELTILYPENSAIYSKNYKVAVKEIDELYQELHSKLNNYKDKKFMVYHDGFQYFERQFNLNNIGVIANNPIHNISIKSLKKNALRAKLEKINCVFYEPQFNDKFSNMVAKSAGAKVTEIDPIGFNLKPSKELYFIVMKNIELSFEDCFSKVKPKS